MSIVFYLKLLLKLPAGIRQMSQLTFIAAAVISATSAGAHAETLRLHHFLPATSTVPALILKPWAEEVRQASKGELVVKLYPAMQLGGNPPGLIDQAIDGTVDIIWTLPGYTPGRFVRTEVFELPFMMTDAAATSRAYWRLMQEDFQESEFADVKILAAWVHSPGLLHSKRPVKKLEDMENLQIRASSTAVAGLFRALGASPVGMPVPAVPEALVRGVIDAVAIPWEVTTSLKSSELVGYHTEFAGATLYTSTFVLAMNRERYLNLEPAARAALDGLANAAFMASAAEIQTGFDAPARAIAVDRGNEITILPPQEVNRWRQAAAGAYQDWLQRVGKRGIDGQALLDKARLYISE